MTRVQLVEKLAFSMKITKKDANTYVTVFLDSIIDALVNGERVIVQGFGSFKVNKLKARTAKKPLTGELIQLPVRHKLSFHAGKELRERVNHDIEFIKENEALIDRLHSPEKVIAATMS